jgi:hypothetical protein
VSVICSHLDQVHAIGPHADGCEECREIGSGWVHLRICRVCDKVGCCDASPHRHATKHYHASGHPIITSLEPGEGWSWCYDDEVAFVIDD